MLPSRSQRDHSLRTLVVLLVRRYRQPRTEAGGHRLLDGERLRGPHFDRQALHRREGSQAEFEDQEGEVQTLLLVLSLLVGSAETEECHRLRDGVGKLTSLQDGSSLVSSLLYLFYFIDPNCAEIASLFPCFPLDDLDAFIRFLFLFVCFSSLPLSPSLSRLSLRLRLD